MRRVARSRSCRAARSFSPPSSGARRILQHYALSLVLVADAISGRELAVLLGLGALSDPRIDGTLVRAALEPFLRRALEQTKQRSASLDRCSVFERHNARQRQRRVEVV